MSIPISNIITFEFRLAKTIQIFDSSTYRFQQYQQVFQMMKNHVDNLENRFLRFVNHVVKDTEVWKNNDRRTLNVWLTENYFLIDSVIKKIRITVFRTNETLTTIRRDMKDQVYQYFQNRNLNVIKHEISLTKKRKFNWCLRQIIDIMNEKLTNRPTKIRARKKILNIDWKKLARKIVDEISDRFMKFARINIIAFRIQIVKNSPADSAARIQSFSIPTSLSRGQIRSEEYAISLFFSLFSTIFIFFHFKWFFVCSEKLFHEFSFFVISNFDKNVTFAKTVTNSNISNSGFFRSKIQNLSTSNLAQKISRKYDSPIH